MGGGTHATGRIIVAAAVLLFAASTVACSSSSKGSHVLLVGTFNGHAGQYKTIQSAVDAAKSGDWILVAPGDYHETADHKKAPVVGEGGDFGAVLITTSGVHLRGMDRSSVIVDGTKAGAGGPCSSDLARQDLGAKGAGGNPRGRNGIVAWKADNVSIENLTTCNFLSGAGDAGNNIWWNGGDDSGKIGATGYAGAYLTATSTFYAKDVGGAYGIFSSNMHGPGAWSQVYASNFDDSGMYVGACQQVCDITIDHAWMEYSALGYSGTNSGGAVVIKNSEFDNNKDGFDTNTQIAGDAPAPQDGACPDGATSPITHTKSCWVFMDNNVHDNNNPNVPQQGSASAGPVGTGMTLSGGRNDTVMHNTFANNGAWGVLFVPYPDSGKPDDHETCAGTGGVQSALGCVYDPMNDALLDNTFSNNGWFGNPSNTDYGELTLNGSQPSNCFAGNQAPKGGSPANLELVKPTCGVMTTAADSGADLLAQVLCDTGFGGCPAKALYPQPTGVVMHPLPANLPTMPNPCAGVPSNAWCSDGHPVS